LGLHIDGGFAQFLKIRADCLLRLPAQIPFEQGAIITDAVSTAYHAVTQRGQLQKGEVIAIFGCGGVGHQAIKIARLLEAKTILAVDIAEGALRRAQEAGADELINAKPGEPARKIKEQTGGEGVDLAIECVGLKSTVSEAMKSLKRGGRLVVLGVGNERVELPPLRVFVGTECCIMGSMGFSRQDARTVIELVAQGKLDLTSSVSATWPLAQINHAIDQLEQRHGDPVRIVVLPQE
jgi:D-arabinose 1-dehydrogenase-like Zn-dependent alcohol dehydrogenase